jgi:hypothetical protein
LSLAHDFRSNLKKIKILGTPGKLMEKKLQNGEK